MCGILGYFGSAPAHWLESSISSLSHRGPDDSGLWISQSVGLGHTRLSILDTSFEGHQPMESFDGRYILVFNGEIYNFPLLRSELMFYGYKFRGHSDTEVLICLWHCFGLSCLSMLNGMFSFAIWDSQLENLFIVRDRSGIKPLFWLRTSDSILFSSEIKCLYPLVSKSDKIHGELLLRQLSYLWLPGPDTLFSTIKSLEPGTYLFCNQQSSPRIERWSPTCTASKPLISDRNKAVDMTFDLLRASVHRQMISDVPLGSFLSGGLDSSSIVALAREKNPDIQCFTINNQSLPDAGFSDDLLYARRVADHLDVDLHEVNVSSADLESDLLWMISHLDTPVADPSPLNVYHICRSARRQGIKVLLSGVGGDDLFTGYRRHLSLNFEPYWSWLPRSSRLALRSISHMFRNLSVFNRRLARTFEVAHKSSHDRLIHYFHWASPPVLNSLLNNRFQLELHNYSPDLPLLDWLDNLPSDLTGIQKMLSLEQRFFLGDHNLIYTDSMSMAAGVEVRVPFLDTELLEFSWCLPDFYKQRGLCSKWVLKQAMKGLLPSDVIHRPKSGFGAPLQRWLRFDLYNLVMDTLSESRIVSQGLFDFGSVKSLLQKHYSGSGDYSYIIWSLVCITLWCEMRVDSNCLN